jgi:hypothetical protein
MTPKVFIPQLVKKYDTKLRAFVPVHNFDSAASFGVLRVILDKSDDPMFLPTLTRKIQDALEDFTYDDYFVAVGDPSVISVCSGIILRRQDYFKMLKWDKKMTQYITMEVQL